MMDITIVHLNKRYFNHCLPSGAWSTTTIEVATRAGNDTQAKIVYESYSSHDNNAVALYYA